MNYSIQRTTILSVLRSTYSHPTAEWIYGETRKRIPNVSLGTVYRNLQQLEQAGEIIKISGVFEKDRYDGNALPHAHLICKNCGAVEDLSLPTSLYEAFAKYAKECNADRFEMSLTGLCQQCKTRSKE